ncbi:MAG: ankyrin repeat domain-containing protein [Thermoanaerobaculia bacterium]
MTALLVKSTVAMLLALLLVMAARRSRASLRHLILAALFAFLLLLPAVQWIAPAVKIPVPAAALTAPQPTETPATKPVAVDAPVRTQSQPAVNWPAIVFRAYLAVASLLLAWLAIGVVRLRRMADRAEVWLEGTARMNEIAQRANIRRSALVVLSHDVAVPLTFGFRRSTIVVPYAAREWSADELTRALRHELEHVRREDWLMQLAARAACALYWPHPLVWSAWRRFCLEAERACDDAVIGSSEPAAYAGQLVSLARGLRRFTTVPALGMASRSKLAQRVDAILDPTQRRGPHGDFSAAIVLVLLIALLVCVAPAKLIAAATQATQASFNPDPDVDFNFDYDSKKGELLVQAAEAGNVDRMKKMLDDGADVNTVAHGDGTALIGAARAGQARMVEFLLDQNADPNIVAPGDGSPLIAAAGAGEKEIVEMLLAAGANRDEIVPGDENPLMQAAWHGHADIVQLLLREGADVNARTWERDELRTPLRLARRGGHEDIVRMLLAAGAKD